MPDGGCLLYRPFVSFVCFCSKFGFEQKQTKATKAGDAEESSRLLFVSSLLGDNARHGAKPISSEPAVAWYDRVINDLLFREASARLDQPVASVETKPD